mgnify:CR=1 FL=1
MYINALLRNPKKNTEWIYDDTPMTKNQVISGLRNGTIRIYSFYSCKSCHQKLILTDHLNTDGKLIGQCLGCGVINKSH